MNQLQQYLEYTQLAPTLTYQEADSMVAQAKEHHFAGICLPPFWVKKARRDLGASATRVVTVVGFPLGYQMTETKVTEIQKALDNGAQELDVMLNLSAFKSNMPWVKIELAKCATLIHQQEALFKVILEINYLNADEIKTVCTLCADAGADFVVTATGTHSREDSADQVRYLREILSAQVGIKALASTYDQAVALIEAGADRIGTSEGVTMMQQVQT